MDVRESEERVACLPRERLEAEITTLAGHLAAAECEFLLMVAEFDRREGWTQRGCYCAAQWLSWKCGIARRSAQEKVRVARALGDLPLITEAFSKGELSYCQVRALTRVADTTTEGPLLEMARHSTVVQLERLARGMRTCLRREEETAETNLRRERRYLSYHWDDDGSLVGSFRLDPEEGASVIAALEAVDKERSRERIPEDNPETKRANNPVGARHADAIVAMAEHAITGTLKARSGGDRYLTVVHVDVETLSDDADGSCHLEDGPALTPETARRLACDSSLVTILEDPEGNPLAVGKKSRTIPIALRRALQARDTHCTFPGCDRPVAEFHHVVHYASGGETSLENVVGLCWFHHRCVHEGGWSIEGTEAGFRFLRPDGTPVDIVPRAPIDPTDGGIRRRNRDRELEIASDTVTTNWCGDPLDVGLATANLMHVRERTSRQVPPAVDT